MPKKDNYNKNRNHLDFYFAKDKYEFTIYLVILLLLITPIILPSFITSAFFKCLLSNIRQTSSKFVLALIVKTSFFIIGIKNYFISNNFIDFIYQ